MFILDILSFYYDINIDCFDNLENYIYFEYLNKRFLFREIPFDFEFTVFFKYPFHYLIKNKFNSFYSVYLNKKYVLYIIAVTYSNLELDFNVFNLLYNYNLRGNVINYYDLWIKKYIFLNEYFKNNDLLDYEYFMEIYNYSLLLCKSVNYNNIFYGVTYNRFYDLNTIYEAFDPFNAKYGAFICNFSELIKYLFFYKSREVDVSFLFNYDFSYDEYILFFSKLIFPSYYFDCFNNSTYNDFNYISIKCDSYFNYLNRLYLKIKKRQISLPLLDLFFNQL